jgi:hypothetical protein
MHHLKGNLLMHHLKFRAALASFDMAIQAKGPNEPIFVFSFYNAGLCCQKLNEHSNALMYLKKANIGSPVSAEIVNAIGFSYYSLMSESGGLEERSKNGKKAK